MKKKICNLWTLLAAIFFVSTAGAQVSTYERTPGYYTFGINGGLSYQTGDVPTTLEGYGLGFTLAKNLYYQPGAILGFDVRGRALYAQTKGQDYLPSYGIRDNDALNGNINLDYTTEGGGPGFVFQNNKTDQVELGIEGVIHLNKLRERTNVNVSLFGGIGLDWYNVKTDQAARGSSYGDAYLSIDTLASTSFIKDQLKSAILDGRYETEAHGFDNGAGKLGIMPNLGVELGYQFTPRFSMGIGHKVTFTKTDLFDGHQWRDNGNLTAEDDIHHYTNLHMRWIIDDKSKQLRAPLVDITNPSISPHSTRNPTFDVRATIKNISSSMDVQFTVNGRPESFNFKKKDFRSFIKLQPGNNEVIVTATNNAGSDSDVVNIFYERPYTDPNNDPNYSYPTVKISNPPYDGFRTDQSRFEIRANVNNVSNKGDIKLIVNGYDINRFDFIRGNITARVDLRNGENDIRIEVRNNDGFASDDATLILGEDNYNRPPAVVITNPSVNPYNTQMRKVTIQASIENIENRGNIRFMVNGYENDDFDFNNGILRATVNILRYETNVVIEANNNDGQASDNVVILRQEDEIETVEEPVITITSVSNPTVDPFNPDNCRSTVIATILNIENRNDIEVWLNGQSMTNFEFNTNTQVFQSTVQLRKGANQIRIKATNTAGTDEDVANTEGCDTQPNEQDLPTVTITDPSRETTEVSTSVVTVKAKVLNVNSKSDITFELNGNETNSFTYNKFTKEVNARITLREGNNVVFVEAKNTGGSANDQVNIIFKKFEQVNPPSVKIERPRNNSITSVENVELISIVRNVESKSNIDVFLNGKRTTNFDYDKRRQEVRANLRLRNGNNVLRVVANNDGGTDEASVNVKYTPAIQAPEVDITKPSNGVVTSSKAYLTAKVKSVRSKNDIKVYLNRKSISFTYIKNEVKATLDLGSGNNVVIVEATNEGGTAQDQVTVVYEAPVVRPPVVKIERPRNNQTFEVPKADLTASVLYVKSRRSISLKVNGKSQSFNFQRGTLTATLNLGTGKNTVTIKATNDDGADEESITLVYNKKVSKPTVSFTAPAKDGARVTKAKYTIKALTKNVTSKNDVILKLNGKVISNFRFTTRTGAVQADVNLKSGRNSISIEARNASGRASKESSVIFEKDVVVKNPPKVTITSVSTPTVDPFDPNKAKSTVIAKVENISRKKEITFTFNNKKVTNFSFNSKTGTMQATMDLKKGTNTFKIKVSNKDGQDETSRNITFGNDGGTSNIPSRHRNNSSDGSSNGSSKSRNGGL